MSRDIHELVRSMLLAQAIGAALAMPFLLWCGWELFKILEW